MLRERVSLPHRLLVLGGGQLGRMMAEAAAPLGIHLTVLDPAGSPPAAAVASHIRGSFTDPDAIIEAAADHDAVTIEIEHVSVDALEALERSGTIVVPQPRTIRLIQDKVAQKRFIAAAGIPVAPEIDRPDEQTGAVWKARYGGYDGYGVRILHPGEPLDDLPHGGYLEEKLDIDTELAVLVARNRDGEIAVYEPLRMDVDGERNVLQRVTWPAAVAPEIAARATDIAVSAVDHLAGTGIFAVELLVTAGGTVVVNEIAPRPHNSGHLTIEAAGTSQFEQHLRAIYNLPLGSVERIVPAAFMVNLIGEGTAGPARLFGYRDVLSVSSAHLHWYGKTESRQGRKMGHITVTAESRHDAQRDIDRLAHVTVEGAER